MRKSILLSLLVALFIPILFAGCDNVLEPLVPLQNNEVRVSVADFGSFDSFPVTVSTDATSWRLQANDNAAPDSIVVTLWIPRQTSAPYTVTVQNNNIARINYCVQINHTCTDFDVYDGHGNGTITVNSIDETNHIVSGTFNGSLVQLNGASGTKTLSSGEFKFVY
jgi:hypothetical protein